MTNTATAPTTSDPPRQTNMHWLAGPPAVAFYLATFGAIVLALDASSRSSLLLIAVTVPIWLLLAAIWLIRFGLAMWQTRAHLSTGHWARWLAVPLVLGMVFTIACTGEVREARWDLSRGPLDQMAADVMAGGSLDRGWVGLYDVATVERTANGFWFVIDDNGLGRWGFAYSPVGEPKESDGNYSPLWQGASFEHLDGPWWIFTQEWD